jgi:hypothetical protein
MHSDVTFCTWIESVDMQTRFFVPSDFSPVTAQVRPITLFGPQLLQMNGRFHLIISPQTAGPEFRPVPPSVTTWASLSSPTHAMNRHVSK